MLTKNLQNGLDFLKSAIIKEITDQGHNASGSLIKSIETIIEDKGSKLIGKILINDYSIYLDKGVRPEKVPYTRGSGGKTSKYIDALISWSKIVKPALSEKERKSFAFAVATTAKKGGHPTKGSYAFSNNGRRKAWSEFSIDNNLDQFVELLELEISLISELENKISEYLKVA